MLRKIAHHLRSLYSEGILKYRAGKGMFINMPTPWGSLFLMLKRLIGLKVFIRNLESQGSHLNGNE